MRLLALAAGISVLLLGGCGGDDEEMAGDDRTWTTTVADNITRNAAGPCPPKVRKALREASEVEVAGEVTCARAVVADKLPPRREGSQGGDTPEAQGSIAAKVDAWYDEKGWGTLTSPKAPGGIFVHFSVIEGEGYRSLEVGQMVSVVYTPAVPGGQDGNAWVAERVTQID